MSCDLALRFASLKTLLRFAKEKLYQIQNFIAFCLKTRCVLSQDTLRFISRLVAFCLKTRCFLSQDSLHFVSRLVAFCLKAPCVLSQDSLRFVSRLVAFCLKTHCVLSQDSLRFVSRLIAFYLKTRCVLSQDSLRFLSRLIAFCLKTRCVLSQDSRRFVSGLVAFCLLRFVNRPSLRLAIPLQLTFHGLPEDVYAAVDSCETTKEIWERVRQMMKGSDIKEQEKKAKLFNEWEKFTSTDGESIESYYHRFMQLMNDLKRNKHFPENIAANLNIHSQQSFLINNKHNPQPSLNQNFRLPQMTSLKYINDPTKAMNAALILFSKAFQLTAPTNNNQRTSSNPRNHQIAQPVINMSEDRQTQNVGGNGGNLFRQYAGQVAQYQQGYNAWIANQNGTGNVVATRAEGTGNGNQTRCYNGRGLGHISRNCTTRPRRRDAAYLQTQLLISQKEEAGIQLQAEEFDFMAAVGDLDKIEEVNANCILMANLQHASIFGTQLDKAPIYDTDDSAEVQLNDNCYDNKIFNMFTQEELYTDLLKPIPEQQLVPQNDNHVTFVAPSIVQSGGTVETSSAPNVETCAHQETVYRNLVDQVAQVNMVNCNMRATNAELKSELARYKIQKQRIEISQEKYDKLEKDQTVQTMHMLNHNPNLFYHPNQKMALGYPNPSYLKKAQLKQQSLYNGNLLLEEHDPPAVYDSEETLKLAQESREKMRFLKKEIKPANYAKINHLSGVFVPQMTKSKEKLFLSNVSNMVTVSKTISIPNEDLSDYTTPSVSQKFLNEVKSSLVILQRVVKQTMTLEVHNWSYSAHKQEADESLDKQKYLEFEIKRLLKASVSHDIMSIVQNGFVDVPSNLQIEPERTKEKLKLCILKKEKEYAVLWTIVTPHVDKPKLRLGHTARTRRPQPKGNTRNARVPSASKSSKVKKNVIVEDHRCSKHMTGNIKHLINFVWKFLGTVCFGNDHIAVVLRYGGTLASLEIWMVLTCLKEIVLEISTPSISMTWPQLLPYVSWPVNLCLSCEQGKSKRASHPPKPVLNLKQRLHLLHMDLCGPMRVTSINGKRYVLVIVDDYSRYTWVYFLRTMDETPEVIKNFLKKIFVRLQAPVIIVCTDNETEFKNYVLKEYFDSVGITHETFAAKTPQQNGVVERRNHTLVEAARTMLIFSHAPLFLRAKALCYSKNDCEEISKLGAKGDIGFFIGYSTNSVTYRVYNQMTKKTIETMNVTFDEPSMMAFEQNSSRPSLQSMTSGQISSKLKLTYALLTITPQRPSEHNLDILFEPLHNEYLGGRPSEAPRAIPVALVL
uniref:Integrase catalytic domain-containing protein n=1 Tax=Tanacetum cinerariifolium TaxID=118510 RepID=A0A6L2K0J8_TANCI|nr:hypothetical protein [Tanacetum cinerariifolium]